VSAGSTAATAVGAAQSGAGPDASHRRLLWRCRRGMKELDLLLSRFARERYAAALSQRQREFEQFLELPDPELAAWLLGQGTAPPRWQGLVQAILAR